MVKAIHQHSRIKANGVRIVNPTHTKSRLKSINPATLETVGEVEWTPPDRVDEIVHSVREASAAWRDRGLNDRASILKKVRQILLEQSDEIARLITREMGKPLAEALVVELSAGIDITGYYADRARRFLSERRLPLHHILFKRRESRIRFEPLGVLGIITPWNWSLLIPMGSIVPALLAGNGVVFKPSELTPLVGNKIGDCLYEAGVPEDIFRVIHGGAETGKALIDSSIEKVFFTGSTAVGQQIYERISQSLKKCVLEMGGSDPAIVCEDADLDVTSSGLVWGGMSNCGQNCNAVERVFVHESVSADLIGKLREKVGKLRIGNGIDTGTDVGPMVSERQVLKMEAIVQMIGEMGGEILLGGKRIDRMDGYFFEPTLIRWDKSVPQPINLEIFGPLLIITSVRDDDEAVRLANQSSYGLSASVWTENPKRGMAIAARIESGTVMINDAVVSFGMAEAGWTGVKKSGIGWVHGEKGLDEMVNIKYINRDPQSRMQKLWWFPYLPKTIDGMRAGLDFLYNTRIRKRIRSIPRTLGSFAGFLLLNRKRKDRL